ncbi:MAG TPA: TIR domain-containing protein [Ktedonobacteraceae bacterium]|nr:TIR domain-containing protein [Ktedonobacteraceae bacterium]
MILDTATWEIKNEFAGHSGSINDIVWAPDQTFLVSGSDDCTIRIWRPEGQKQILEGFISNVTSLSLSYEGSLLASRSTDGNICIWDTWQWEMHAILENPPSERKASVAFSPRDPILATLSEDDTVINIWEVDIAELLNTSPVVASSTYRNAKVVLVGETGVGKSGLSLVLTGQSFEPTDSTHGRKVLTFEQQNLRHDTGQREQRELLLWDLAGQPGYRLIHQLYLNETSIALVVFDSRSETDPLAGIDHWVRALRVARQAQENEVSDVQPLKMFLVAARTDRGGKNIGSGRIEKILKNEGFDGYFATSAKEGAGIAELIEAIRQAIDWEKLTRVTSSLLFQRIKDFLAVQKQAERLLVTYDELFKEFCQTHDIAGKIQDIATQFRLCIKQVEQKGLIKQLSFGKYILLQPELLDSYASSLVIAVRDEPDELGSIEEQRVLQGDFSIPQDQRLQNREQEKLLLIAMVEDLLNYEIALRDDLYLVFPSQSMRENPDLPDPKGKGAIFTFEGPIAHIYATLVVRLSHSGLFRKVELWKNAVTYTMEAGGSYGLFLHNISGGRAELTLFFDQAAQEETRFHFEEYVRIHLERRALAQTVERRPIFVCPGCETPLDDLAVRRRKERNFTWMKCGVCDERISLLDRAERLAETPDSLVSKMDTMADLQRDQSTAVSSLQGKIATGDFDVFLCYRKEDKLAVQTVGEQLKARGILPWLDEWELRPGFPWQRVLEQQIEQIKSAAVFVGKNSIGPWEQLELEAFLRQFARRQCPVIPVILTDAVKEPRLPIFLEGMTWVDFRQSEPDPLKRLVWGITGKRELHS